MAEPAHLITIGSEFLDNPPNPVAFFPNIVRTRADSGAGSELRIMSPAANNYPPPRSGSADCCSYKFRAAGYSNSGSLFHAGSIALIEIVSH